MSITGIACREAKKSFAEARKIRTVVAAVSRLYDGIHYRDANENGTARGLQLGQWVISMVE